MQESGLWRNSFDMLVNMYDTLATRESKEEVAEGFAISRTALLESGGRPIPRPKHPGLPRSPS